MANEVSIVTWLWSNNTLNYTYQPEYVNVLQSMLERNTTVPFKLICITDADESKFSNKVRVIKTPEAAKALCDLTTPEGNKFPTCYRRLWMFSEEAKTLGERIVLFDLDVVIMSNIDSILSYKDDFVGFRSDPQAAWGANYFVGCLWSLKAGARTDVWTEFIQNPVKCISTARNNGYRGSDQAWISYKLFGKEKMFSDSDGIYTTSRFGSIPPNDAKLIQFNGDQKPWKMNHKWVKDNWK